MMKFFLFLLVTGGLWLLPSPAARAEDPCIFVDNKTCLIQCCGRGRCPKKTTQCPVVDKELGKIQAKKTERLLAWLQQEELTSGQTTLAALLTGEASDPLEAVENAMLTMGDPQQEYNMAEYQCLPRHEELIANKIVDCTGLGDFSCRMKTMAYALNETVFPKWGITTPDERTATVNAQRTCYFEQGGRAKVLGEMGMLLLLAYKARVEEYIGLIGKLSSIPCYDPDNKNMSLEQLRSRFMESGVLAGAPSCLRQDIRILTMLERDTALLHLHRQQMLGITGMTNLWGANMGNRNPSTTE